MAAAQGHLADGANSADDPDDDGTPVSFRKAVESLRGARLRPEMEIDPTKAPQRLAPFAYALEAAVVVDDEELADGRLVLLHDPDGQDSWQGTFRLVTLARAELEPELADDPLLPEVCWSWLTGALDARGVAYGEPSGTVTRAGSYYFGGMSDRPPTSRLELRASWTPREPVGGGVPDLGAQLAAWSDLLCQCAGLPPVTVDHGPRGGVVPLPQRRGPQR
ncbi:DUF3000 domain-containing protein [Streptomyces sp. H27-D2]|uniref:DUF3000 domain-containing protein n=1 Tax=Streptomyces sp. H27-D2 TaxID=3046304 RepID=UPI002DB5E723|nr:DUF3000 domain-containing protein [Streptomyces sp. H27-D2]MEC4019977.1 DUF3000 domain-containing protein [Streptomyces sp. H27-D2]